MGAITNVDLLWVGLAVAGAGTLGFSIYFANSRSMTSRAFLWLALVSIAWSLANFSSARVLNPLTLIWLIRLVIFFASWLVFALLILALQFPSEELVIPRRTFFGLLIWTAVISLVTLTPLVFETVVSILPTVETRTGPGVFLFAVTVFGYIGTALWVLFKKTFWGEESVRQRTELILAGFAVSFIFLAIFEFIFPAFLNDPILVPYGGLFLLPFIATTAYAIMRYRIFNPRVALYGILTFVLATATFFDVLVSSSVSIVLYRSGELVLILVAGILLIRSMAREFELEEELKEINKRQETLIHFIGHEVKGFLTKAAGVFSMLDEGDFGPLPDGIKPVVAHALEDTRHGVTSVSDILKASNLKRGTVSYTKAPFDLKAALAEAVERARATAEQKGLKLSFTAGDGDFTVNGDRGEIVDHVLRNLIDNAVNYTIAGSVDVSLAREAGQCVFAVKDTGVGITDADKAKLFTEGGHGAESQKVNVNSTGYGLFIAKQVVDAHGGTISASSQGPGKGSTFTVTFPA